MYFFAVIATVKTNIINYINNREYKNSLYWIDKVIKNLTLDVVINRKYGAMFSKLDEEFTIESSSFSITIFFTDSSATVIAV